MVTPKVSNIIWALGAGHCMYPNCNENLVGDYVSGNEDAKFGFVAHIVAENVNGPRGHPTRSKELRNEPDNLMLLCHKHHKLIDVDAVADHPESRLLEMRRDAIMRMQTVMSINQSKHTLIIRYGAKVGAHQSLQSFDKCAEAVLPDRFPKDRAGISIEVRGSAAQDSDPRFWENEIADLRKAFDLRVRPLLNNAGADHISVFGLAPIPLLVEFGKLLGDHHHADVYQLHREPTDWSWKLNDEPLELALQPSKASVGPVALKLEVSDSIGDERVRTMLGKQCEIWSLSAKLPKLDAISTRADLEHFRVSIRDALNKLAQRVGNNGEVHVFAAIPVSVAIELGRCWMQHAHPSLLMYNRELGNADVHRHTITARNM